MVNVLIALENWCVTKKEASIHAATTTLDTNPQDVIAS
jgi:hypothetical protein